MTVDAPDFRNAGRATRVTVRIVAVVGSAGAFVLSPDRGDRYFSKTAVYDGHWYPSPQFVLVLVGRRKYRNNKRRTYPDDGGGSLIKFDSIKQPNTFRVPLE